MVCITSYGTSYSEPDLLCDFLLEIGACSASVTDADAGTPRETPLFADPWQDSLHWAAPVWNRCNVTAHFPQSIHLDAVFSMVQEFWQEQLPPVHVATVPPHKDWVGVVQSSWPPIRVADRFVLRFPWHTDAHVQEVVASSSNNSSSSTQQQWMELWLQGGIAFGTGEHATTQLCLEWLVQTVPAPEDSTTTTTTTTVLDYGAGSGILGMGACALGASSAVGVDIDLDACRIANANARENGLEMRTYLPASMDDGGGDDDESQSLLMKAHAHARSQVTDAEEEDLLLFSFENHAPFDIVVANILAAPLIALACTLYKLTRPGGCIGLSGVLLPQGPDVVAAYQEAGFVQVQVAAEKDGWVLITGQRASDE